MKRVGKIANAGFSEVQNVGGLVTTAVTAALPPEYLFKISMYEDPPTYEISVEEFEELAISRLECTSASS